jgi:hypothetical protein
MSADDGRRPGDLMRLREATRVGRPFLVGRDASGEQRIVSLVPGARPRTIGRDAECDVVLDWDGSVSRTHAELQRVGGVWVVVDDGLSRNGTFVNGHRVGTRTRLSHGDVLHFGDIRMDFHDPTAAGPPSTVVGGMTPRPELTTAQRRVLVALARPFADESAHAVPRSNPEIARELVVGVDAVKSTLRILFEKLGVGHLPQNQKRAALVRRALDIGVITPSELRLP